MEWYQLYFACGLTWLGLTGLMAWLIDRRIMARQSEFFAHMEREAKRAGNSVMVDQRTNSNIYDR